MGNARIHIIACGGTIAGKAPSEQELIGYQAGELTIDELMAAVPELAAYAAVTGEQLCNIDSSDMTEAIWLQLSEKVQAAVDSPDIDGVVITHGTDTLEETAYFLNLTVHTAKPVVLVGSMRPATAISADGPLNLLEAVRLAACGDAGKYGVLISMNGQIGSARNTTKTNTTHVDTFRSWELGFLGYLQNGEPHFYQASTRLHTAASEFSSQGITELPPVGIVYCYVGMSPDRVHDMAAEGVQGIVVAGFGHGNMPVGLRGALLEEQKKRGLIIVRTSRTGGGIVSQNSKFDGSGFIVGDNLSCQKAKILLQLALLKSQDSLQIQKYFDRY